MARALLVVLPAITAVALCALHLMYQGFPDGHLTELDRAEGPLAYITIAINTVAAISYALRPDRRIVIAYVASMLVLGGVELLLTATLEHGHGG